MRIEPTAARVTSFCAFLICCATSVFAMPDFAAAAQRATFNLRADKGFRAGVVVGQRRAVLSTERTFGARSSFPAGFGASYSSHGSISGNRVRARFGGRGRIAVTFKVRRTVRRNPPSHCEGPPIVSRTGVFIGTIRFHGERGYTTIDASRAPGKMRTNATWSCGGQEIPPPPGLARASGAGEAVRLDVKAGRTVLEALTTRPRSEEGAARFVAGTSERREGMRIRRAAYAFAREKSFAFDPALSRAKLRPPRPFRGSARYTRGAGAQSWTGSLSVELPGAGVLPLAGQGYAARLYRGDLED